MHRKKTAQLNREIDVALIRKGKGRTASPLVTRAQPRTAYRLQLAPSEIRAVELARGRYAWADMLATHVMDSGLVAFTEAEMWQWIDDVDSESDGGDSMFPLASPGLATKLQDFYDSRV